MQSRCNSLSQESDLKTQSHKEDLMTNAKIYFITVFPCTSFKKRACSAGFFLILLAELSILC